LIFLNSFKDLGLILEFLNYKTNGSIKRLVESLLTELLKERSSKHLLELISVSGVLVQPLN